MWVYLTFFFYDSDGRRRELCRRQSAPSPSRARVDSGVARVAERGTGGAVPTARVVRHHHRRRRHRHRWRRHRHRGRFRPDVGPRQRRQRPSAHVRPWWRVRVDDVAVDNLRRRRRRRRVREGKYVHGAHLPGGRGRRCAEVVQRIRVTRTNAVSERRLPVVRGTAAL